MERAAKQLDGRKAKVGIAANESGFLAGIHEYGCTVPVTEKMRAFLHHNGVHLKPSTTQIVIPERSFLRAGYDACSPGVIDAARRRISGILDGSVSPDGFERETAQALLRGIQDFARSGPGPGNAALTLWGTPEGMPGKGGGPLVDTGAMIESGIEVKE